ncbi:MAG: hypothetical protein ACHQVS_01875 [Candidatus Babeliales bacterium]
MKREKSGVHLLLGLLLVFSASVGLLYGDKKWDARAERDALEKRCAKLEPKNRF